MILSEIHGNSTVIGVLNTIAAIYTDTRTGTHPALCHATTAAALRDAEPGDTIELYGWGDTVVHSAVKRQGKLIHRYPGVSKSKLLPSGNLSIVTSAGATDEMQLVRSVPVTTFMQRYAHDERSTTQ